MPWEKGKTLVFRKMVSKAVRLQSAVGGAEYRNLGTASTNRRAACRRLKIWLVVGSHIQLRVEL